VQRDRDEVVERVLGRFAVVARKSSLEPSQERSIDVNAADVAMDVRLRRFDA
jgi:hypothetical protein